MLYTHTNKYFIPLHPHTSYYKPPPTHPTPPHTHTDVLNKYNETETRQLASRVFRCSKTPVTVSSTHHPTVVRQKQDQCHSPRLPASLISVSLLLLPFLYCRLAGSIHSSLLNL